MTKEELNFIVNNYPDKGKLFCMKALNKKECQIRYIASKLKLKFNRNSEFFNEFQRRAAASKVGKKRPFHSELMKKYAREGRFKILTSERTKEQKENYSKRMKKNILEKGHPKGMLGKTHSVENKKKTINFIKKNVGR